MLQPLNNVKNLPDPLKMFQCNWTFSVDSDFKGPQDTLKDLMLRCQSFTFPTLTGDTTEVEWGGFKRVYAGKQTREGEWSVEFTEVWDSKITDTFKAWFNTYHDYVNGKIRLLKEYTATVKVNLLNPDTYCNDSDGKKSKSYDMTLYDMFPTSISYPQIEASSSNPITISAKFHYNYFLLGGESGAELSAAKQAAGSGNETNTLDS